MDAEVQRLADRIGIASFGWNFEHLDVQLLEPIDLLVHDRVGGDGCFSSPLVA
jgi:hypothetical protein